MVAPRRGGGLDLLAQWLDSRAARFALAALIVVSVLPYPELERSLRGLFLLVFGAELAVRTLLLRTGRAERTRSEYAFLFIDAVAFVSFLPIGEWMGVGEVVALRALRLARLLVLVRFTRELSVDVWTVITRREQLSQLGLISTSVLGLAFVSAVLLSHLAIPYDYDALPATVDDFWDRVWWSFRQVESPDNLVQSLRVHPLLAVISFGLTIMGVFIFSYLIGVGASVVEQVVRAERRRRVPYVDHMVVVGPPGETEILVRELVRIYAKNRGQWAERLRELSAWLRGLGPRPRAHSRPRLALLGDDEQPPAYLLDQAMRTVVYRQGDGADPESLDRVGAADAKRAVFLSDERAGDDSDAITVARLGAFRQQNPRAHVFVEVRDSENREVVQEVGGEGTYALDISRILGLFLAHHLIVPGIAPVFRELLTADGQELYTHLYADADERALLADWAAREAEVDFAALAPWAHAKFGVLLLGVFLGDEPLTGPPLPVERLEPRLVPLGGQPIPLRRLRGFLAVADTYGPLSRFGRAVLTAKRRAPAEQPRDETVSRRILAAARFEPRPVRRVLVTGNSPALAAFVSGLDRFVPDVHVRVVLDARDPALPRRLAELGVGEGDLELMPVSVRLEHGGELVIHTHQASGLADFAAECVGNDTLDTAVFLADAMAPDADARTSLRVLRFTRWLRDQGHLRRLHLLMELGSLSHAESLSRQLSAERLELEVGGLRKTLVSTHQIRNYFLVHSAFVPGSHAVYERLLSTGGAQLMRLELPDGLDGTLAPGELTAAFGSVGAIPVALDTRDGLRTNPPPGASIDVGELRGIFVIVDRAVAETRFAGAPGGAAPPAAEPGEALDEPPGHEPV